MKCLKLLVTLLLLLLSSSYCQSQSTLSSLSSIDEQLGKVESKLVLYKTTLAEQLTQISNLEQSLKNSENLCLNLSNQYQEASKQLTTVSTALELSENKCKIYKKVLKISIPTALILGAVAGTILGLKLN